MTVTGHPRAAHESQDAGQRGSGRYEVPPRTWVRGAHLAVLWAFAVLQPVFEVLEGSADFFVVRDVRGAWLVGVVLALAAVPPALLVGVEALVGRINDAMQPWVHLVFVFALAALFALVTLNELFPRGGAELLPTATLLGGMAVAAYARFAGVRSFVTALAPAPLIFVVLFLFFSPVTGLVSPGEDTAFAEGVRSRTPIVVVVFDELPISSLMDRSGRIDAVRYPNFARLSRDSIWFRNTAAAGDETVEATPAILTGRRATRDQLPILADHPENLFTLFGASHRVQGMEHATLLCPPELCPNETPIIKRAISVASAISLVYADVVAPDGLGINFPQPGITWEEALAARNPEHQVDASDAERAELSRQGGVEFRHFLSRIRPAERGRPPLYFLHSSLPHLPWLYLPSGRRYENFYSDRPAGLELPREKWTSDSRLVNLGYQRHLLQAEFADRALGELLDLLREDGLYERSLIAVTSDHGSSYVPAGSRRVASEANAADIGLVPFFLKEPGQTRGRIVDRLLQTIDILPTMADVLDISVPWKTDGRSAFEMAGAGRPTITIQEHHGASTTVSRATLEAGRKRTLARKISLFGSGAGGPGVFGLGPHSELIGRSLREIRLRTVDASAEVEDAGRFRDVDLDGPFVPAFIEGRITGDSAREIPGVAVALNGRIRAVGYTYPSDGEVRFAIVVPDRAFRHGDNSVRLLAIPKEGGTAQLADLGRPG